MPLRGFGDCFKLDVSKEVMPYNIHTYESGICRSQYALDVLKNIIYTTSLR